MDKICYKVVSFSGNLYKSAVIDEKTDPFLCLNYYLGKFTRPKIGKIFVFASLDNAVSFNKSCYDCIILRGLARDVGIPKYRSTLGLIEQEMNYKYIYNFWNTKKNKKKIDNFFIVPKGTLTCSSFMPLGVMILPQD